MKKLEKSFDVTAAGMRRIARDFHSEMERGLAGKKSSLKMIPTYVRRPTGAEKGTYIALDLGGTNFRVLQVELKGGGRSAVVRAEKFALRKAHIATTAGALFGFIARSIKDFMAGARLGAGKRAHLGFTFSFPVKQAAVDSGILIRWTKAFRAKGAEGRDVVALLDDALGREGVTALTVSALLNDTVGTLVAKAYEDRRCDVGVILGTGTNACYYEPSRDGMVINIEWGNFNKLKLTPYDRALDKASGNPGQQILEKMVSGMYLGELARLVCADLVKKKALFAGRPAPVFGRAYAFGTEQMSRIAADRSKGLSGTAAVLKELGVRKAAPEDMALMKKVCDMISTRAARVSATALAAVLTRTDPAMSRAHTAAIDGSLFEKYPRFSAKMKDALRELFGQKARRVTMALTKDGSGKGAAIVAAVAAASR
ncbi:MAG: hexokinase [Candidatus Omnitrophica bacterium]|nr:hexokinase [Candidatus Omnitrophota bacterium]